MKIIFSDVVGRDGLGGNAWSTLQHLLGFRALGHEVYYLEDCGELSFVWNWTRADWDYGLDYPAAYLQSCLEPFGFGKRWIYRTNNYSRGMALDEFRDICRQSDLLIMRAAPLLVWRTEYEFPRRRAFIDGDPGFTQIAIANGNALLAEGIARCDVRFTVGRRIGETDCPIPNIGGPWHKTVHPIFLPEWPLTAVPATHFTSIMRWRTSHHHVVGSAASDKEHGYGQRDKEFPKFVALPRLTAQKFCLAVTGAAVTELLANGWEVIPGEAISRILCNYRAFIQQSRAELAVPKQAYVRTRSGWFSDRSVCYLASGRPVVIEDTGLSDWLPIGEGLLTFHDIDSALSAIDEVNRGYERHQCAARGIAQEFFATERVLPSVLEIAMS